MREGEQREHVRCRGRVGQRQVRPLQRVVGQLASRLVATPQDCGRRIPEIRRQGAPGLLGIGELERRDADRMRAALDPLGQGGGDTR